MAQPAQDHTPNPQPDATWTPLAQAPAEQVNTAQQVNTAEQVNTADTVAEARRWLEENWSAELALGEWWDRLARSGWAFPAWPEAWFGRGLKSGVARSVVAERQRMGVFGPPSGISTFLAAPTILAYGTDEQKQRYLPGIATGRDVWCQLFSEPEAGSDMASLQTRAVADGDEWIINGQKVWSSGAQFARYGILIARTDPDLAKHKGITYFLIDMDQPGVEVRPLREMTGEAAFNEVFFTDARVQDENRLGARGEGWRVAMTTLSNERDPSNPGLGGRGRQPFRQGGPVYDGGRVPNGPGRPHRRLLLRHKRRRGGAMRPPD